MNCSPAAESVITFLRPSISQSRLRRFPISYVEPLADHLAAQSAFYVDRAPAEPMTPALPIMPAILKGGQIVDRVLTTRNARLAPRPTLWKECASRVKAGSGHQSVPRIQLSLLLFVDKRRDSSGLLVVGDGSHFLSIGRNCDLLDTVKLAIALIGDFDGAVPPTASPTQSHSHRCLSPDTLCHQTWLPSFGRSVWTCSSHRPRPSTCW